MSRSCPVILLFVRWPEPGRVKTRLAATVGATEACRIHRFLAERCYRAARAVEGARLIVCGTGAPAADFERWLPAADAWWEQPEGDLGVRLGTMFAAAFSDGAKPVCAVGSDAPLLSAEAIGEAITHLAATDVAIVPATDGGYVLIGMRELHGHLFHEMPWSTPDLYAASTRVCMALGLSYWRGPTLGDIDTADDWFAFVRMGTGGSDQ